MEARRPVSIAWKKQNVVPASPCRRLTTCEAAENYAAIKVKRL
jgi:hypothetical protein